MSVTPHIFGEKVGVAPFGGKLPVLLGFDLGGLNGRATRLAAAGRTRSNGNGQDQQN